MRDGTTIEARVTIQRPIETVFGFNRAFRNLPRFRATYWASSRSIRRRRAGPCEVPSAFECTGRPR